MILIAREIIISLISGFLGTFISKQIRGYKTSKRQKNLRYLWNPDDSKTATIFFGCWNGQRNDGIGEFESLVNMNDTISVGVLYSYLMKIYKKVNIITEFDKIDWESNVISIGGPIPNELTANLGSRDLFPMWFDLSDNSTRIITNKTSSYQFKSEFDPSNKLIKDVGFFSTVRSPFHKNKSIIVIASNFGIGNLGITKFLCDEMEEIPNTREWTPNYQWIFEIHLNRNQISETKIIFAPSKK